jgi:L-lactate dehydrogenase complex protein LldG
MAEARTAVLGSIRAAIGASNAEAVRAEWAAIPRAYKRAGALRREEVLELLEDRLRDYDAHVVRVKAGEVSGAIAKMLAERGKRRLVVPEGLEQALGEKPPADFEFVTDTGLTWNEMDELGGVVTASTVAIAETGTIVLQVVPGQGRRALSLIPDYHLCVVRAGDVVETVPEAMERLAGTAGVATTFISGPSATADIEMTRIKGVHGPRVLDVILTA